MKPSTVRGLSHERLVSTAGADIKTATVPKGTSHVVLAVESVDARVTFDGSDPVAGSACLVYPANQMPVFIPIGQGTTIKFCSTAGSSTLQLAYVT